MSDICSACPVLRGECPHCKTYWVEHGTKRYGVRPVDGNSLITAGGDTRHPGWLNQWPNVTIRNVLKETT